MSANSSGGADIPPENETVDNNNTAPVKVGRLKVC